MEPVLKAVPQNRISMDLAPTNHITGMVLGDLLAVSLTSDTISGLGRAKSATAFRPYTIYYHKLHMVHGP